MIGKYMENDKYLNSYLISSLVSECGIIAKVPEKHARKTFLDLAKSIAYAARNFNDQENNEQYRMVLLPKFNKIKQDISDDEYLVNMHRYFRALKILLGKDTNTILSTGINSPFAGDDNDLVGFGTGGIEWFMHRISSVPMYNILKTQSTVYLIQFPIHITNNIGTVTTGDVIIELRTSLTEDKMRNIFISMRLLNVENIYMSELLGINMGGNAQDYTQHLSSRLIKGWYIDSRVRYINDIHGIEAYSVVDNKGYTTSYNNYISMHYRNKFEQKFGLNMKNSVQDSNRIAQERQAVRKDKKNVFKLAYSELLEYFKNTEDIDAKLKSYLPNDTDLKLESYIISRKWVFGEDVSEATTAFIEQVKEPIILK